MIQNNSRIVCPDCGQPIDYANINIDRLVAKCDSCRSVFNFSGQLADTPRPQPQKRRVEIPESIEVLRLSEHLDINVPWRSKGLGFFLFFAVFWNAIVLPFALFAIVAGQFGMLLALSAHLAVGIGMGYFVLAKYYNMTRVTVSKRTLNVRHEPLKMPFYPNRSIEVADIGQLFVKRYVGYTQNKQPVYQFSLNCRTKGGEEVQLLKGMGSYNHALFVEQEVEDFLGIADRPMNDEWRE